MTSGAVAVGDFNGDGKLDLVIANYWGGNFSILLGNGNGTFQSQVKYPTFDNFRPMYVEVADVNGDGKLDIITDQCESFGNGNGTFQPCEPGQPTGENQVFADLNGDGILDAVGTDGLYGYGNIYVALGNGDGTFSHTGAAFSGYGAYSVALADFNGDGKLDIVTSNVSYSSITVFPGNGDGTFGSPISYPTGSQPYFVAVGDFNGDGLADVVTSNGNANSLSVLLNEQQATYSQSGIAAIGTGTQYVLASYLGDGSRLPSQSPTVPLVGTSLLTQTITFAPMASPVTYGVLPIYPSATGGGSGNPIIFSVISGPGSISSNVLTVTGVGTIVVAANQAGNADYSAAPQVTQSVVVNAPTPAFSVSCSPNPVVYNVNTTCPAVVGGGATGTVTFYVNGVLWATAPLSGSSASESGLAGHTPGTYSVTASYSGDSNNNPTSTGTTLTITQASDAITWFAPPSPVTYGVPPITLLASSSAGLGVNFSVLSGPAMVSGNTLTITGAGTVVVAANQPGNAEYSAAPQVTATIIVNKATPTITWGPLAPITYGTPLSGAQLNATAVGVGGGPLAGTFVYAPPSGTVLAADTQALSVTFTPSDTVDYNAALDSTSLTVTQAPAGVSVVCSPNPITYGSQTTSCTATVGGTATGSVTWTINGGAWTTTGLSGGVTSAGGFAGYSAGSYTIGVTYAGDGNYLAGSASTTLTIQKANPTLSWGPLANMTYGAPLGPVQLNATSSVPGTFAYTPAAGNLLPVGSYVLNATFTPTNPTNYNSGTISTPLTVVKVTTSIDISCAPNPIAYGPETSTCTAAISPLATGTVSFFYNGTSWAANVPISGGAASATGFSNMPAGSYTVVANYSGDSNFNPTSNFTTLTITPSSNAVTLSCSPTSFVLGSTTTCTAVAPAPDGTVAFYSTADLTGKWWNSPFPAGGGDLGTTPVATTQDASLNYNISGESWANTVAGPAGVNTTNIYARWTGTFVSPVDGNYTIGVNSDDGANVYVNGTLLVGNLSTSQSAGADLTYTQSGQIPLTMGATNTIVVEYQQGTGPAGIQLLWTPPGASSATLLGWTVVPVNADGIAQVTGGSPWSAGTYNVTAVYSGDANYASSTSSPAVQVTVTQATPVLTWSTPASITYGTPLSSTQLDATSGGIAGTFAYTPAAGTVLPAGTQTLSVTFTPTDLVDYVVQTTTVNLLVNQAPLIVTPNPVSRVYGQANPALSGTITGLVVGDIITATYSTSAVATTPVGVYTTGPIGITDGLYDPNGKLVNYILTQNTGTFTITQATPGLTWATPAPITYGTPLSGTQLNATSSGVAGTFVYTPAAGTMLTPGSQVLTVIFTPTDSTDYQSQSATVTITVNKATLTVTPNSATKVFGATNPTFAGTVTGLVPGDTILIGYTSSATQTTPVGAYSTGPNAISVTSSGPVNELGYYNFVETLGTFTITQSTTLLTWTPPAAIIYGTPLSATQLDASSGGVAGTFAYTPAAGAILPVGTQMLSVTFTPTDTADYSGGTITVPLTVNKAPLTVTPNNVSRLYGVANPAFTGTVTGLVAGDTITASYASAATLTTVVGVYSSGPNAIAATLSDPGNKLGNYTLTQNLGTLTITQSTTTLTWATPAAITYGTSLSAIQLNATSGGVAGTFVYTPPAGTVLPVGSQTLSVVFTPTDSADYSGATATVTLTVNKAPLTVTPNPASKVYGTPDPTFTGSVTGLVAGDTITATYASAATITTGVGVYSSGVNAIAATLSDPGSKLGNYTLTQNVGTLTITQATTTLTWATPAAITYGTPLSATQLNATSGGVAGTFVYSPAAGAVPAAGSQTLSVMFTPTDTADYGSQIATVNLQVNKAALVVTPNPASRLYAAANPVFTGTITGMIAGDGISATYASGANATTPVGVYSAGANAIAPTLIDPGSKLGNYTVTQNLGALTITQVTTGLTWATPAAITYGTPLSGAQLNSTSGGVAGTFVYSPAAGAVLSAGAHPLNVTFTPTDGVDYSSATASVTLTVNPAVLTVTPAPSSKVYGTANPVFTGSITGMIPGDGISATYSSAATATTVVGVYASGPNAIVATLSDPQSKLGNYTLNQTAGTFTITQATTVLTWATPASISYETALSSTQLDATSGGVAGTFVYTPAAGTVLSAGSHTLSVAFTPTDAVDYSAATATVTLTVTKTTPTVILTSSANPSVYGGSVTFTATTNAAGTGTVLFYDGGSLLGPGTISGGVATYTLNSLGGGTHSITASYAGDSNYLSALSAALSQVVTKSPVTITVTSSVNPSNFGQSVTFTFTVTGVAGLATPTGSIAFTDGGTLIASPVLNPLGVATYTTVTLSGGSHSLAAVYGGDANYQ